MAVVVAACAGDPGPLPGYVSQATWTNGSWPFTVSDGILKCYVGDNMVTFTANGIEYGLNAAATHFGDFADLDPIWRDGPAAYVDIGGERQPVPNNISVARFVAEGLELCS